MDIGKIAKFSEESRKFAKVSDEHEKNRKNC